jgi:probable glucitol transport protein GutA
MIMEETKQEKKAEVPPKKKQWEDKVGAKRMFLWQSREASMGCNLMALTFITIYCTDTLKIPAAIMGTLLMASKIVDGFTDIFFGYIVDRTNTKWGRARPYELSIIGMWLCTWLMFTCPPEFALAAKCVWIFAMYTMVNAVFTTFLNASRPVYLVRVFSKTEQHVATQSYGAIVTMAFTMAFNISFPIFMARMATSPKGWSVLVGLYTIPLAAIGMLRFFTIKETINVDATTGEKLHIKDVALLFGKNLYVYIIAFTLLIFNFAANMGVNLYYYTYIVKNVSLMGAVAALQLVSLPVVFIFPSMIKKYSVKRLIALGFMITATGYIINFFALANFPVLVFAQILIGIGNIPISMLSTLLIIECADYNESKKIPRLEGTMSGVTGFAAKLGLAMGAGVMGVALGLSGYTGDAVSIPDSAILMIRLLYSLVPAGLYLITILILRFYKLDKKIVEIRQANEEARQAVLQKHTGDVV